MTKVFVYGTLLSGYGNNSLLEEQTFLGEANTKPELTLVNVGGFPGLIEGGNTAIQGEVYEVDDKCLARLDQLEGAHPYNPNEGLYGRLNITLSDGQEVTTYRFNRYRPGWHETIKSGSWRDHVNEGRGRNYCG